jgi:anti-anti-sigma factor
MLWQRNGAQCTAMPIEGISVPVTVEQSEGRCFIRLEGEVNITSAAEVKKLLLQALASGTELRVDLERATELDVTAMQLLWAAEREARASGKGFILTGRIPGEISAGMSDAGFEKFMVATDTN